MRSRNNRRLSPSIVEALVEVVVLGTPEKLQKYKIFVYVFNSDSSVNFLL